MFRYIFVILDNMRQHGKIRHAPSEDLDQPWHPPCLLRVFAFGLKRIWTLTAVSDASDNTAHM